jgi:hypothetical protein
MNSPYLGAAQIEQLAKLAAMPDEEIDTADIPEAPIENWSHARRGKPDAGVPRQGFGAGALGSIR